MQVESPSKNDTHSGRLVTQKMEEKFAAVESYVTEDRQVMVRKVAEEFDFSYGTAKEILTSKLELKQVYAR